MVRRLALCLLVLAGLGPRLSAAPAPERVRIDICEEGLGKEKGWPTAAKVTSSYEEEAFGLFELPHKYVSTGVRGDRPFPTLVRATASLTLPAGRHRLLLRSRGAARLLLDGRVVLENPFDQPRIFNELRAVGGEVLFEEQDKYLNLGPDFRFAPPGNRESWGTFEFTGAATTVVLETLVGGLDAKIKVPFRPELGETVAAVSLQGSAAWRLLSPGNRAIPYTDEGWARYEEDARRRLEAMNDAARAARRAEHAAYWQRRRQAARDYLASTPEEAVPALPPGYPAANAIDHFLAERIAQVAADYDPRQAAAGIDFHREIKPILEAKCLNCHQGTKAKGGLRLDLRTAALQGGQGDGPAIVPHQPDQSALLRRILSTDAEERMPAKADPLGSAETALLRRWIAAGAPWPDFPRQNLRPTPLSDDLTFLRRLTLDTVGVVPSEAEIRDFLADARPDKRTRAIDRLLADPRWADHAMAYWLDVLAENPNLINPTLNNTGPFRWWLHESFRDNKPLDLLVTELVRLEGSERFGGPAGFGTASGNDVPAASKGVILTSAFLGVEMKCARCHDSPTHLAKQKELFGLAALLDRKAVGVPKTSSVPLDVLSAGGRKPLVEVTLPPGSKVEGAWPFPQFSDESAAALAEQPDNSRDRLAALLTAPRNERFAQVMANRIWERLMGRGLVDLPGDWERATNSHPRLLRWLGRELVRSGYDTKVLARLILTSHAYQRAVDPSLEATSPLFVAPAPRRIGAEQLVDSLFAATGKPFVVEPVNIDLDSSRPMNVSIDLGRASRSWMLGSTSNERDRPSLSLPRHQAVSEVLEVFGWRPERPDPIGGLRRVEPNVLQSALLANGTMMSWLTRLSDDHGLTALVLEEQSVDQLIERVYLRLLTRRPSPAEHERARGLLTPGFAARRTTAAPATPPAGPRVRPKYVAWSNHMSSGANVERVEQANAARRGDPATTRLEPGWRQRFEDVLWGLLNAPEWTHIL